MAILSLANARSIGRLALVATAFAVSAALVLLLAGLIQFILPISAMEARDDPKAGYEFGFWLLVSFSLPIWVVALWLTTLATIFERGQHGKRLRRSVWGCATLVTLLAILVGANVLGMGDLVIAP